MLRFIDLKGQLTDGDADFAWYDTITDKFLTFSGNQTWSSWDDFAVDYEISEQFPLSRFKPLFRDDIAMTLERRNGK